MSMLTGIVATGFIDDSPTRIYFFSTYPNIVGYVEGTKETIAHKGIQTIEQIDDSYIVTWRGDEKTHKVTFERHIILDLTEVNDITTTSVSTDDKPLDFDEGINDFALTPPMKVSRY